MQESIGCMRQVAEAEVGLHTVVGGCMQWLVACSGWLQKNRRGGVHEWLVVENRGA
jgi:hypothetical protein